MLPKTTKAGTPAQSHAGTPAQSHAGTPAQSHAGADAAATEYPALGMLEAIRADAQATAHLTGRPVIADAVMRAMLQVPRELFVPEAFRGMAYRNRPLSIGHGQTISQPFIVALMTDLLDLAPSASVLEVGTGSGYQAAVLAAMGMRVHSVEILEPLARQAARALAQAGYRDVALRAGDGSLGWSEKAPFDAILVTAAPLRVPFELIRQLAPKGRIVVPVGAPGATQELRRGVLGLDGALRWTSVLPVAFVPFQGASASKDLRSQAPA